MENNETILFTNWSKDRFAHPSKGGTDEHCSWDGVGFAFEPGESKYLPGYIARLLAKHLANRELLKEQETGYVLPKDPREDKRGVANPTRHEQLMAFALGEATKAESALEAEIEQLNKNMSKGKLAEPKAAFCDSCDSKGRVHKKDCPKKQVKTKEEEFEGLNEE